MFVHLHNHTHYSLLDGFAKPQDYIAMAKQYKCPAVAITDHGVLYGLIEFYKKALENDIKPILGCEFYISPKGRFNRDPNEKYYHLILLAYNNEGYQNLLQLNTKAHFEGFYYKPRIDFDLLKEFNQGLIGLTACTQGQVPQIILNDDSEKAIEAIKNYQNILGKENFFLELQHHPEISDQQIVNDKLKQLSKMTSAPLVVTNDCHYPTKEDSYVHDILICIQTQKNITDDNRMKYDGDFSMRDPNELASHFQDVPEALQNTAEIANRCKVELKFDQNLIPTYQTPFNKTAEQYLSELCEEGLKERYGENITPEIKKRMFYELNMIHTMGFDAYFLIVQDFVMHAKNKGIVVGPGRGSAAGSIVSYCLKITDIDPMKYGLLFERFLNPERVSMPDIDVDFADNRRDEVLEYVSEKYGKDKVAQIITFGTMAARAAVRDVGRVLGYPYSQVDKIAKVVPPPLQGTHIPLKTSIKDDPELAYMYTNDPDSRKILDFASKLEGTIRQAGTHACAVVIAKDSLVKYTALQKPAGGKEGVVSQYSMKPLEKIGLLKMDFLGLKNLTIIQKTLKIIKRTKNQEIKLNQIPFDDKESFDLLQKGQTVGVFQMESAGMRRYLKSLKPTTFEDIIAMVSLYRPGPMEWIPDYIKGKHGKKKVTYLHSSLEPILKETYGIALYQEQILEIAKVFAGFTLGEADILRRAIGKKIPKELKAQKKKFIEGAEKKGHKEKLSIDIFENVIEPFAAYGFNKSHAAGYALIAYQTAYLKAHYPAEFMASLLSCDADNTDRVVIEINECENLNIKILPPNVNESLSNFTVIDDQNVRFGLSAIKGIGQGSIDEILKARGTVPFANLEDFIKRVTAKVMNKKTIESLAYSGALDELAERNAVIASVDDIIRYAKGFQNSYNAGQTDIFGILTDEKSADFNLQKVREATAFEKLKWEKEYLGLFVSGHPLKGLKKYFGKKVLLVANVTKKDIGKTLKMGGLVMETKRIMTKAGAYMMIGSIEDPSGRYGIVLFPKIYDLYKEVIKEDQVVIMDGKLEARGGELQYICQAAKGISLEAMIKNAKEQGFYDETEAIVRQTKSFSVEELQKAKEDWVDDDAIPKITEKETYIIDIPESLNQERLMAIKLLLQQNRGDTPVELHIANQNIIQRIKLPFGVAVNENFKAELKALLK